MRWHTILLTAFVQSRVAPRRGCGVSNSPTPDDRLVIDDSLSPSKSEPSACSSLNCCKHCNSYLHTRFKTRSWHSRFLQSTVQTTARSCLIHQRKEDRKHNTRPSLRQPQRCWTSSTPYTSTAYKSVLWLISGFCTSSRLRNVS